jgi:hypothetical protein
MRKLFSADPTLGGTGIIAARITAHIRRSGTFLPGDWPLNTSINGLCQHDGAALITSNAANGPKAAARSIQRCTV